MHGDCAGRLKAFNLKVPEIARLSSGEACLEKMPGVAYRYDVNAQAIHLNVSDEARVPLDFDMQRRLPAATHGQDLSAVLNYGLFATGGTNNYLTSTYPQYQGASASLDGHIFSKYGVSTNPSC